MITHLGQLGIPNAQAFRPDGAWSSTVGSGKSETVLGAQVGAIMEEVEKWAQERYSKYVARHVVCKRTFRSFDPREMVLDPRTLDLPYDTCYSPGLSIDWVRGLDVATGSECLIPAAAVTNSRLPNDIYYSPQGARKTVTTNGLASGMCLAEALTHALCEYIERHSRALDSIAHENPGGPWVTRRAIVDLEQLPTSTMRLRRKIEKAGYKLVVRSIANDVAVPTFVATILIPEDHGAGQLFGGRWRQASGWAAHPDTETAANMAILEASQTIMTNIAGAREDLSLAARSLGRHERTDSRRQASFIPELDPVAPRVSLDSVRGFLSDDAAADVRWIVDKLRNAGISQVLMVDFSTPKISPCRVVRVLIPGLETINPFHTGLRARAALVADLI